MKFFRNCDAATMDPAHGPYGLIADAAIIVTGELIRWVGRRDDAPVPDAAAETVDLGGALVTPALIDCHTHLVFGGHRAREFEMRLGGRSYEEIAVGGGGILSTMRATRSATLQELVDAALPRVDSLIGEGVAAIEIKSGYGLDIDSEIAMLKAARRIAETRNVRIRTSWLAAHAVPPEFDGASDRYLDEVAIAGLRLAHAQGLVDAVDGFCEGIAFSPDQVSRLFAVARELGLPVKLHADQLSDLGGAGLAASFGALSADHLEYASRSGLEAMAEAGTVAVLLPGAIYTLGQDQPPALEAMRHAGLGMAVANDGNPGSSPLFSLLLAMNMACTLFGLNPQEALEGATLAAARAIDLEGSHGSIVAGKQADLAVWNVGDPAELSYRIGFNPLARRIIRGQPC